MAARALRHRRGSGRIHGLEVGDVRDVGVVHADAALRLLERASRGSQVERSRAAVHPALRVLGNRTASPSVSGRNAPQDRSAERGR
eukprot:12175820-Alexandrium_andersonii.AAC.1